MDYKSRLATKLAEPELLDLICSHVAGGGSVIDLSKLWDLTYADLTSWLRADKDRWARYDAALKDRLELADERWFQEVARLAHVDLTEIYDADGRLKELKDWPEAARASVQGMEVEVEYRTGAAGTEEQGKALRARTTKLKFTDKAKFLEMLGRHRRKFVDRVELTGRVTLEELLLKADETDSPGSGPGDGQPLV